MGAFIIRRVLLALPILVGVSMIVFSMVHLSPGDPEDALIPLDASLAEKQALARHLGLDRAIPIQYGIWLKNALQGDLGRSLRLNRKVTEELGRALKNTFILAVAAAFVAFSLGIALGSLAAFRQGQLTDRLVVGLAISGVSIPNFWLGIMLIIIFAVEFNLLPPARMESVVAGGGVADVAKHMIMPVIALSMISAGVATRFIRTSILEILNQEFVVALRAMGLKRGQVLRHVLKNAAPPFLTVLGLQFGYLLGGSVLVETVFTWPGAGLLLYDALLQRDLPLVQATILVLASFFVFLNLIVDLAQGILDPRIRRV